MTDYVVLGLLAAPVPLLASDEGFVNALNDTAVIYQSALIAVALAGLATLSTTRARPFVYGDDAPLDERTSPNGALSFISGHTTAAFALSTSLFWTVKRRHGNSVYTWAVFTVGTAAAATVGTGRVLAGKHFATDAVAGMIVGSAVGTLIPMLHDSPVAVAPSVDEDRAMILVRGQM